MAAKAPATFVVVRDSVLLAGGMLGIGYQQVTGELNQLLLIMYFSMIGGPGISNGRWLLSLLGGSQSSASPSSPSQPASSSTSQEQ